MIERKLTNLTKAQVEALMECFDFIANGYEKQSFIEVSDLWVVLLINKRTSNRIKVFIHPNRYRIVSHDRTRKKVTFQNVVDRYRIVVNSDNSFGVIRLNAHVAQM